MDYPKIGLNAFEKESEIKRADPVQGMPSRPLIGFPQKRVDGATPFYRAHHKNFGPWWFSSSGDGRFDLSVEGLDETRCSSVPKSREQRALEAAEGMGTCYLGDSPATSMRERLGLPLVSAGCVPISEVADVLLSKLHLHHEFILANINDHDGNSANFGVTTELAASSPYEICQSWAREFNLEGLHGIYYKSRFNPALTACSVALFGESGSRMGSPEWRIDVNPMNGLEAAMLANIEVFEDPEVGELTVALPYNPM